MLRFSSVIQVKCNWYRMGTIVLTIKKNNCTASLLEAVSRFILRKNLFIESNYKSIGEQYAQQEPFTPIKFAK